MKQKRKNLTPWQRIMRAAKRGTGLRLSFENVSDLAADDAIETRAQNDNLNAQGIPDEDITR